MKRFISFVLILVIVVSGIGIGTLQSQAIAAAPAFLVLRGTGAMALTGSIGTLVSGVGLLLVSAGLIYAYHDELLKAVEDFYNTASAAIQLLIWNSINTDTNKLTVSDELFNQAKAYVDSKYNSDNIPVSCDKPYGLWTISDGFTVAYSTYGDPIDTRFGYATLNISGHELTLQLISGDFSDGFGNTWKHGYWTLDGIRIDSSVRDSFPIDIGGTIVYLSDCFDGEFSWVKGTVPYIYFVNRFSDTLYGYIFRYRYSGKNVVEDGLSPLIRNSLPLNLDSVDVPPLMSDETIAYTTYPDAFQNPAWDWKNTATGVREVTIPLDTTKIVEATAADVAADTVADAVSEDPIEDEDVLEGSPTAIDDAWKLPDLRDKFPFSIPWDLKNAFEGLVATPEAPRWVINFPDEYFVGGGRIVIDFDQFDDLAAIIRWGVLAIFNVGLILGTRKLIG